MLVKLLLSIILWGTFTLVVLKVDYPENITSANFLQLSSFFISLLLALTFTINIFLNFSSSFSIVLGLMILLALKALDSLNIVSAALTVIAISMLLSYFRKFKKRSSLTPIKSGLTSKLNIPRLRSQHRRKNG